MFVVVALQGRRARVITVTTSTSYVRSVAAENERQAGPIETLASLGRADVARALILLQVGSRRDGVGPGLYDGHLVRSWRPTLATQQPRQLTLIRATSRIPEICRPGHEPLGTDSGHHRPVAPSNEPVDGTAAPLRLPRSRLGAARWQGGGAVLLPRTKGLRSGRLP